MTIGKNNIHRINKNLDQCVEIIKMSDKKDKLKSIK